MTGPRLLLDACVIYPTVMREVLLGAAKAGLYQPRWSARILEEWVRATVKLGPEAEALARGEAAVLAAQWPKAEIPPAPGLEARLWLPDPADVHVLAVAIAGSCDGIVTMNTKDFPRNVLAEEGVERLDPDGLMLDLFNRAPERIAALVGDITQTAEQMSGTPWTPRRLMKKARLPRLGRAVERWSSSW